MTEPAAGAQDTRDPVPYDEWLRVMIVVSKLASKYPWVIDIVGVTDDDDWADIITRYIEALRAENRALGGKLGSPAEFRKHTATAADGAGDRSEIE